VVARGHAALREVAVRGLDPLQLAVGSSISRAFQLSPKSGISRLPQVGRLRTHNDGRRKEVAMRRKATFLTAETDEALTWLFAGQLLFALALSFLGLWLH
jgi:hypothetical protein